MFKFLLIACVVTKGGTYQDCAPGAIYQTQADAMQAPQSLKMTRWRTGFFVRAVCVEVE